MESCRIIRRNDDLPHQTLDGRVVVVDAKAGKVHLLNGTGSRIWTLLEQGTSASSLLASLRDEYSLETEAQDQEVRLFLEELLALGLVVSTED